ncbi:MAG: hypothetical protein LC658_11025 [Bacteroidales bacterium]|nr:hypothetical protein [Bacteroidales bacterium]
MDTLKIKKELHQYIDNGDERFLKLVHAIATNYNSSEDFTLPGSPFEIETYRKRIRDARDRVENGYFTSHEDLEKEMEQW